ERGVQVSSIFKQSSAPYLYTFSSVLKQYTVLYVTLVQKACYSICKDSRVKTAITFELPYSWYDLSNDVKCANLWLKYSFHVLKWSDGDVPYEKMAEVCASLLDLSPTRNVIIWVKGAQKKEWLQPYFLHIYNIEDLGCPSLKAPGFQSPVWLRTVHQDFTFPLHVYEDYYTSSSDSDTTTLTLEE
ncbi:hypothetical protein TSAR_015418, partial [Trichomalopsis sarcophagae]